MLIDAHRACVRVGALYEFHIVLLDNNDAPILFIKQQIVEKLKFAFDAQKLFAKARR